jgi:hypothetical protein
MLIPPMRAVIGQDGRENRNMRIQVFVFLIASILLASVEAATPDAQMATVTSAGTVEVQGGFVVPAFPKPGGWKEMPGKSSERYDTRHFMFFVPGASPAIELYVCSNLRNEPPDGGFEIGLVGGFINGFAGKSGLRSNPPSFDDRSIGTAKWKHTVVPLQNDRQTLWIHAYILVHNPSLTFIALRAREEGAEELERFLAGVQSGQGRRD